MVKLLVRLDQVVAFSELSGVFAEGIMRTEEGPVVKGTRGNLLMVKGHEVTNLSLQ